jgi:hypothetical protein
MLRTSLTQISFAAIGQYCHQLCELELRLDDDQLPEWLELLTKCPLQSLILLTKHQIKHPTTTLAIQSFDLLTNLQIFYSTSSVAPPTTTSHHLLIPFLPPLPLPSTIQSTNRGTLKI